MARSQRWERASAEWPGFPVRDLSIGAATLVVALIVLLVVGINALEAVIVGSAGLLVLTFYAVSQFAWAWLRAPSLLLADEVSALARNVESLREQIGSTVGSNDASVTALRERTDRHDERLAALEAAPKVAPPKKEPQLDRRLTLLNTVRLGKIAWTTPGTRANLAWAENVVQTLNRMGMQDELALFLKQDGLAQQLPFIERLAAKYDTGDGDA